MNTNEIFIGNIKICTRSDYHCTFQDSRGNRYGNTVQESEVCKENAILLRTKNGGYVDLEELNLRLWFYIKSMSHKIPFYNDEFAKSFLMRRFPSSKGVLFVDESSLKPFEYKDKNISIRKLRKTFKPEMNK